MGAAYFIVLEHGIDGFETGMDGKALAREIESLDEAAQQLGVRPLSEFYSADPAQIAEMLEAAGDMDLPPLEHFSAEEGLASVQALAAHAAAQASGVKEDLRECERILNVAAKHGVRWRFDLDF